MEFVTQKLVIPSAFENMRFVEAFLLDVKSGYSIPEGTFIRIRGALTEAANNAIRHGNKFDPAKKVEILLDIHREKHFCFTVQDEGNGFDYQSVVDPLYGLMSGSGRGISTIIALADSAIFSGNGNKLEICFVLY